jgi:hypothetical protein
MRGNNIAKGLRVIVSQEGHQFWNEAGEVVDIILQPRKIFMVRLDDVEQTPEEMAFGPKEIMREFDSRGNCNCYDCRVERAAEDYTNLVS